MAPKLRTSMQKRRNSTFFFNNSSRNSHNIPQYHILFWKLMFCSTQRSRFERIYRPLTVFHMNCRSCPMRALKSPSRIRLLSCDVVPKNHFLHHPLNLQQEHKPRISQFLSRQNLHIPTTNDH